MHKFAIFLLIKQLIKKKSLEVIFNAKTQRPTVCNALDTLLVHTDIARELLPQILQRLRQAGVSFRLDQKSLV